MDTNRLNLLKNGLCFILQSIKHFENSEQIKNEQRLKEKELKYAVLHLFSGIFLVLKEKLKREHWSLLFSDVNQANDKTLQTADFYGVNFRDCKKRLSEIVSVKFTKKEEEILLALQRKRNKIEYFFEPESLSAFKSVLAHGLDFTLIFIEKYLNSNLLEDEREDIQKIKKKCFALEEFVKQRIESIKQHLDEARVILYCDECSNKAIIPDEDQGGMKCVFCSRFINNDQYDKLYYSSLLPNITRTKDWLSIEGNTFCCECEAANSLVETKDNQEYFCLHCHVYRKQTFFGQCQYCGVIYDNNGDHFFACPICLDNIIHKPD